MAWKGVCGGLDISTQMCCLHLDGRIPRTDLTSERVDPPCASPSDFLGSRCFKNKLTAEVWLHSQQTSSHYLKLEQNV